MREPLGTRGLKEGGSGSDCRVNTAGRNRATGKEDETKHRRCKHNPRKGRNGGASVGHSGRIALRREQCDMTLESRNSLFLGNGSVNGFPQK
jgi:hypothetical protein